MCRYSENPFFQPIKEILMKYSLLLPLCFLGTAQACEPLCLVKPMNPFYKACETNDVKTFNELLPNVKVETLIETNQHGWTPLHELAIRGNEPFVKLYLERFRGITIQSNEKYIPLYDIQDKDGSSPLFYAALSGNSSITELLLDAGANQNIANNKGRLPLHEALSNGHEETATLLITRGAPINAKDNEGVTAFSEARDNKLENFLIFLGDVSIQLSQQQKLESCPVSLLAEEPNNRSLKPHSNPHNSKDSEKAPINSDATGISHQKQHTRSNNLAEKPTIIAHGYTVPSSSKRANGKLIVTEITGGTPPYQVSVDGGPVQILNHKEGMEFSRLDAGGHFITVVDVRAYRTFEPFTIEVKASHKSNKNAAKKHARSELANPAPVQQDAGPGIMQQVMNYYYEQLNNSKVS